MSGGHGWDSGLDWSQSRRKPVKFYLPRDATMARAEAGAQPKYSVV